MTHDLTHNEMTRAIACLEQEAAAAGDRATVRDCQRAVRPSGHGYAASRKRVVAIITEARMFSDRLSEPLDLCR